MPEPRFQRSIRFSEDEWNAVCEAAEQRQMKPAEFVREAAARIAAREIDLNDGRPTPELIELIMRTFRGVHLLTYLKGSVANLAKGRCVTRGASRSPHVSALARRSCSNAMASVRAHGPRPKARSTIRASPTMPPWRANIPAWPLRSARITSKPLIVA